MEKAEGARKEERIGLLFAMAEQSGDTTLGGKHVDKAPARASFPCMLIAEKQLASAVLELPPKKRAKLADLLMQSLVTKRNAGIAAAWNEEAESRAKAFKRGELKAVSVEKALGFKL